MYTMIIGQIVRTKKEIVNFPDIEDKDILFYRMRSPVKGDISYQEFTLDLPSIESQLTPQFYNLIKEEMFFENFHDIKYKKVENKEFRKLIEKKSTQKIRFYKDNAWHTYYFDLKSKSRTTKSDFPSILALYSCYPKKGLKNFNLQPCQMEQVNPPTPCCIDNWFIASGIKGIEPKDDWKIIKKVPFINIVTGAEVDCWIPDIKYEYMDYFVTKPGENDYMLIAKSIDYDNYVYEDCKPTEYYVMDYESKYYKEGSTNLKDFIKSTLDTFNSNPEKVVLYPEKNWVIKEKKDDTTYDNLDDLFADIGYSLVGRHNYYFIQWNKMLESFISDKAPRLYCEGKQKKSADISAFGPNTSSLIVDLDSAGNEDEMLLNNSIDNYETYNKKLKADTDVKIESFIDITSTNYH